MVNSAYGDATRFVRNMDDEHLQTTWFAIKRSGLAGFETVNDIPVDDWIELIYLDMCDRGFAR
jgi:TFIIF-interacting CTD phosphatase-like protein